MDIKQVALNWIKENIAEINWQEDDWVSLTDDYDLNTYIDSNGKKKAVLYPVIDGETNPYIWTEVLL